MLIKRLSDPVFTVGIIFILLVLCFPRGLSGIVDFRIRPLLRGLAVSGRKQG